MSYWEVTVGVRFCCTLYMSYVQLHLYCWWSLFLWFTPGLKFISSTYPSKTLFINFCLVPGTKQPKLTAIIQSCRLTLFGHIMRMDDNADAKRILLASPPADWRRQLGHPRITWLSTVQQDLKQQHLTLPEAADLAQNRPLWRMMSTYGATQSWVACQKRRRWQHTTV